AGQRRAQAHHAPARRCGPGGALRGDAARTRRHPRVDHHAVERDVCLRWYRIPFSGRLSPRRVGAMKRTWLRLGLAVAILSPGAFTAAEKPSREKPRDGGITEARILVKQLEAQAEFQRASLRQTEANLEQARPLLRALEDDRPEDAGVTDLKA